jgi:hypothetical protein
MNLMPGPCCICGEHNYPLSAGGSTICPACDCGNFGIERIKRQAARYKKLEADYKGLEADYLRRHKDACDRFERIKELEGTLHKAWDYINDWGPDSPGDPACRTNDMLALIDQALDKGK